MAKASARSATVVVTVADSHVDNVDELAQSLSRAGLVVDQVLVASGIIMGAAPAGALARLRRTRGVKAVEHAGAVQIAPPDADIQ